MERPFLTELVFCHCWGWLLRRRVRWVCIVRSRRFRRICIGYGTRRGWWGFRQCIARRCRIRARFPGCQCCAAGFVSRSGGLPGGAEARGFREKVADRQVWVALGMTVRFIEAGQGVGDRAGQELAVRRCVQPFSQFRGVCVWLVAIHDHILGVRASALRSRWSEGVNLG